MPAKHVPISPVVSLVVIIPLVAFWLWMFQDMLRNTEMPDDVKQTWAILFILLNVFAAAIYFATIYRKQGLRDRQTIKSAGRGEQVVDWRHGDTRSDCLSVCSPGRHVG